MLTKEGTRGTERWRSQTTDHSVNPTKAEQETGAHNLLRAPVSYTHLYQ